MNATLTDVCERASVLVCDGVFHAYPLDVAEIQELAERIASCSIALLLEGTRGRLLPIAGYLTNRTLGMAKLHYLIVDRFEERIEQPSHQTKHMMAAFARKLFADHTWLNIIVLPFDATLANGSFSVAIGVAPGRRSVITMTNAAHRPWSARRDG